MFGTRVLNTKKERYKMLEASAVLYANGEGINRGRVVLHSDLNNFFASVECRRRPDLAGFPVAVCGNEKDRHGIVLAKNQLAKSLGVKTGQTIWQAKQLCKDLFVVEPDYEEYLRFSRMVKRIYSDYSDRIESFGMDEAWIELTGNRNVKNLCDGKRVAEEIRNRVKRETGGLTVSVGVSDNKVFAKLASDYKKPDAVTVFGPANYFDVVARLDIGEMLFVGKQTKKRLNDCGIKTIGGAAQSNLMFIKSMFGKNGERIFRDACGFNTEPVEKNQSTPEVKSIGNSVTLSYDLNNYDKVKEVFHALSEKVTYRMRNSGYLGTTVQISVRDTALYTTERQCRTHPTNNALELARCAEKLYRENYNVSVPVRSVGVRMTNLVKSSVYLEQENMFDMSLDKSINRSRLDNTLDEIRVKFGTDSIFRAVNCRMVSEHHVGGFYEG